MGETIASPRPHMPKVYAGLRHAARGACAGSIGATQARCLEVAKHKTRAPVPDFGMGNCSHLPSFGATGVHNLCSPVCVWPTSNKDYPNPRSVARY